MSQHTYRIGLLGLALSDALVLRSILRLCQEQLAGRWMFDDNAHANVLVLNPQHPQVKSELQVIKQTATPYCISLLKDNGAQLPGSQVLKAPVRVGDFISLLRAYERRGNSSGKDNVTAIAKQEAPRSNTNSSDRQRERNALSLTMEIQKENEKQRARDLFLTVDGLPQIHVNLPESKFRFCDGEAVSASDGLRLLERLEGLRKQVGVEINTSISAAGSNQNWLPLDCLYWHFGMQILCHDLLPGLNESMSFKLKRWPDFGRIGSDPSHLKMAAFMVRRALTILELRSVTRQSPQTIIAFINACALCNLLVPSDKNGRQINADFSRLDAIRQEGHGLSNVFSAIRSVFRLRA